MSSPAFAFDSATHEYRIGSRVVPACTYVLAGGGLVPYSAIDRDVLERKSELGKQVHRACHLHNLEILGSFDAQVKPFLDSWIHFKQAKNFKPKLSEFQVIGELNGMHYGMQIDCAGDLDGEEAVIEYKIGQVLPHHGIQLAGYAAGLPHAKWKVPLARFNARKRIALQLREDGRLPRLTLFEKMSDFFVFSSLLYVDTWKKQNSNVYKEKTRES